MRLTVPTDFEILQILSNGRRNNAINIAAHLDKNRSYINTRLPVLADYDLLDRVGPAPNSGLYEITERGRIAASHREEYEDDDIDFEALIDRELADRE
ncbi:phage repressor protein [Halorubrum sp. E3]|uniref:Phage repressor protein n=1 Tax=Halorubrum persicum TaxID=1383844 RepID=A0A2G1WJI4_9EURY|nr:phage repressor protein [Halorubrum persicum]OYR53285.1 phage repressor protein [Halorubrum sp. E3]PHQ39147.1 phage repressor protein [Halorubrum persicum]